MTGSLNLPIKGRVRMPLRPSYLRDVLCSADVGGDRRPRAALVRLTAVDQALGELCPIGLEVRDRVRHDQPHAPNRRLSGTHRSGGRSMA
jgi:hypothetical protein